MVSLLCLLQVTPIPGKTDTLLAQTTDFFYPLVDDPYMQVLCLIGFYACLSFYKSSVHTKKKKNGEYGKRDEIVLKILFTPFDQISQGQS